MTFSQKANEMQQAWDDIAKLLESVRFILVEAKVPEHQVMMPRMVIGCGEVEQTVPADPLRVKIETYVAAYDWLHNLSISAEYAAVVKVKALLPQHVWDMYILQEFRGLQEQILLDKAQIALRKLWKRNRPTFFGKVYKHVEEEESTTDADPNSGDASDVCVRSEGTGSDAADCGDGQS